MPVGAAMRVVLEKAAAWAVGVEDGGWEGEMSEEIEVDNGDADDREEDPWSMVEDALTEPVIDTPPVMDIVCNLPDDDKM
jgi:hypothetical protein